MIKKAQQLARQRGGRCLSSECRNAHDFLLWECSHGHTWQASPYIVNLSKQWCPTCSNKKPKLTIEDMRSIAKEREGSCLSATYNGSHSKLLWRCASGYQWEATPASIKNGSWCPHCAGNKKHTLQTMHDVAGMRGGRCLSKSYSNNMSKLLWQCSEGHEWEARPMKVLAGNWCPKCAISMRRKQKRDSSA